MAIGPPVATLALVALGGLALVVGLIGTLAPRTGGVFLQAVRATALMVAAPATTSAATSTHAVVRDTLAYRLLSLVAAVVGLSVTLVALAA